MILFSHFPQKFHRRCSAWARTNWILLCALRSARSAYACVRVGLFLKLWLHLVKSLVSIPVQASCLLVIPLQSFLLLLPLYSLFYVDIITKLQMSLLVKPGRHYWSFVFGNYGAYLRLNEWNDSLDFVICHLWALPSNRDFRALVSLPGRRWRAALLQRDW